VNQAQNLMTRVLLRLLCMSTYLRMQTRRYRGNLRRAVVGTMPQRRTRSPSVREKGSSRSRPCRMIGGRVRRQMGGWDSSLVCFFSSSHRVRSLRFWWVQRTTWKFRSRSRGRVLIFEAKLTSKLWC
jgi:hypothetical protein